MSAPFPRRPRDAEALVKQSLRRAMGVHRLAVAQVADMVDESDDTVEQWLSAGSRANVPLRILAARRLHRNVRELLVDDLAQLEGEVDPQGADEPEAQSLETLRFVGQLVTMLSTALARGRISSNLAAQVLLASDRLRASNDTLSECMRARVNERVATGAFPARGGGQS